MNSGFSCHPSSCHVVAVLVLDFARVFEDEDEDENEEEEDRPHPSFHPLWYLMRIPGSPGQSALAHDGGSTETFRELQFYQFCKADDEHNKQFRPAGVAADDSHRSQAQMDPGSDRRPRGDVLHRFWLPGAGHSH